MKRVLPKSRPHGWLTVNKLSTLMAICLAISPCCVAQSHAVPTQVRSLLKPGDTLLAYQESPHLFGNGLPGTVVAIRHDRNLATQWSNNPCELVILAKQDESWLETERSNRVVNCIDNDILPFAPELVVNDYLETSKRTIKFTNWEATGKVAYEFRYVPSLKTWRLKKAVEARPRITSDSGTDFAVFSASYPWSLKSIELGNFDPSALAKILQEHPDRGNPDPYMPPMRLDDHVRTQRRFELLDLAMRNGIHGGTGLPEFMAIAAMTTDSFRIMHENVKFRDWKKLKKHVKGVANRYSNKQLKFAVSDGSTDLMAAILYEGRKDLGNTETGDGTRFIGRGYVHVRGRAGYRQLDRMFGMGLEEAPYRASYPDVAATIAIANWQIMHGLRRTSPSRGKTGAQEP